MSGTPGAYGHTAVEGTFVPEDEAEYSTSRGAAVGYSTAYDEALMNAEDRDDIDLDPDEVRQVANAIDMLYENDHEAIGAFRDYLEAEGLEAVLLPEDYDIDMDGDVDDPVDPDADTDPSDPSDTAYDDTTVDPDDPSDSYDDPADPDDTADPTDPGDPSDPDDTTDTDTGTDTDTDTGTDDPTDPDADDPTSYDLDISLDGLEGETCRNYGSLPLVGDLLSGYDQPSVNEYTVDARGDDAEEIDSFRVSKLDRASWDGSGLDLDDYDLDSMYSEEVVDASDLSSTSLFRGEQVTYSGFDPEVYEDIPATFSLGDSAEPQGHDVVYRVEALDADGDVMATSDFHNMEVEGDAISSREVEETWSTVTGMMPMLNQYDPEHNDRGLRGGARKAREDARNRFKGDSGFMSNVLDDVTGHLIGTQISKLV